MTTSLFLKSGNAAEYFVNLRGNDGNDGLSHEKTFCTISKGLKALRPGDTLTIGPGEYRESIEWAFPGEQDKQTVVRAEMPGTVWLRGDEDMDGFKPARGSRSIWEIEWPGPVHAVNEVDTFTVYHRAATLASLEFMTAAWYHDEKAGKLYIRSSDSQDPVRHRVTIVKQEGYGFRVHAGGKPVHNLTIEGLAFSGFNSRDKQPWRPGHFSVWGLNIANARNCRVRNCTALLNGSGIAYAGAENSIIENCRAYGNGSVDLTPGGGIVIFGPAKDSIIRQCVAHDQQRGAGIRFYSSPLENCRIQDCVAWNNPYSDMWLKGTDVGKQNRYDRCATPGTIQSGHVYIRNSVAGHFQDLDLKKNGGFNLTLAKKIDHNNSFADPERLDYRPQANAPFLKKAPDGGDMGLPYKDDVYFVKPGGNDSASGDSIANAWKTIEHAADNLQPGQTLYILPGQYSGGGTVRLNGTAESPIILRGRSGEPVVFQGGQYGLTLENSAHVALESLNWTGTRRTGLKILNSENIHVKHCGFDGPMGIESVNCSKLTLTHNAFNTSLALQARNVKLLHLAGNIFQGTIDADEQFMKGIYSDYNSWPMNQIIQAGEKTYNLASWQAAFAQDLHSLNYKVDFIAPARGRFFMADNSALAGRGPLFMPIGPYHLRRQVPNVEIIDPQAHSLTATTANLEWGANCNDLKFNLHWGDDQDCRNILQFSDTSALANVGLTGLKPGNTYYYRVQAAATPRLSYSQADPAACNTDAFSKACSFKTPEIEPEARTYHVATNGDNGNDGLSREKPFRTVAHAAAQVKAGDTVLVHAGEYIEEIVIRGTGDTGRPITFKNAPGARVVFSGDRFLATVWRFRHKNDIILDGFYFTRPADGSMSGMLDIGQCRNVLIQRCLYDGRGGNTPAFLRSWGTDGTTLRNNVMISGFFGANISRCRNYTFENNVFYINSVCALHVMRDNGASFVLRNNIFYDMINMKIRNQVFYFNDGNNKIVDQYNAYYMRLPANLKIIYNLGPGRERKKLNLEQFFRKTGQPATSFHANPQAPALDRLTTYASVEAWQKKEGIPGGNEYRYDAATKTYKPFDFADFFPTNPACLKAGNGHPVGLDPQAFKHLNP